MKHIEVGYQFGKLKVIGKTNKKKNNYSVWLCKCECGNTIELDTRTIQRQTKLDCGCSSKVIGNQKDLTNKRFGKLVCIEPTSQHGKNGGIIWKCHCDCGNDCLVESVLLTHGSKKSCGCLTHMNLIGQQFGQLTVLKKDASQKVSHWICQCSCGNQKSIPQANLLSGKTKSCGCLQGFVKQTV